MEIETFDALFLSSVELIQISVDSLQSCKQLRKTEMKTYLLSEAVIFTFLL